MASSLILPGAKGAATCGCNASIVVDGTIVCGCDEIVLVDGYAVTCCLCIVIGLGWWYVMKGRVHALQRLPASAWLAAK